MNTPSRHRVHVYATLAVASVILAWGFWRVAPHQFNGDEWSAIGWAIHVQFIDPLAPQFRKGGNLHIRLFAALLAPLVLYWQATGQWATVASGDHLYAAARTLEGPAMFAVHDAALVGRALSVVAAIATVYLIYRLGRTLHSHRAGLLSALALTGMAMFVTTAKLAVEDALHVGLTVAVLSALVWYLDAPDRHRLLAVAVTFGLAVSAKASAGLLLAPLAIAVWRTHDDRGAALKWLGVAGATAWLAYVATTPAILVHPDVWVLEVRRYVDPRFMDLFGDGAKTPPTRGATPFVAASYLAGTAGPVSTLAVAIGLPAVARYRHRIDPRAWTVALYGGLYVAFLMVPNIAQPSHIVPLHPVLALAVGLGAAALLDTGVEWRRRAGQVTAALVVLSVVLTGVAVVDFGTSRANATDWMDANIEPGATVDAYAYRAYRPDVPDDARLREFGFEPDLAEEPERGPADVALRRAYAGCADYIVISSKYYGRFLDRRTTAPRVTAMYRDLLAGRTPYRTAARFGPSPTRQLGLQRTVWQWVTYRTIAGGANPTVVVLEREGAAGDGCSG